MRQFGLIGKTLKHSFSKQYFTQKFKDESIEGCQYELFELANIAEFPALIEKHKSNIVGLNVTIPYKKEVIPFLDEMDDNAQAIGAVNTIKVLDNGNLKGFNTDYIGFKQSLQEGWNLEEKKALVLGTGGASEAIKKALSDLSIPFQSVSRQSSGDSITYQDLFNGEWVLSHEIIINTTPLGTFPKSEEKADLPYSRLTSNHLLYDLVYNPEITAFMQAGLDQDAKVKNGYAMLIGQAEAAWKIWNNK